MKLKRVALLSGMMRTTLAAPPVGELRTKIFLGFSACRERKEEAQERGIVSRSGAVMCLCNYCTKFADCMVCAGGHEPGVRLQAYSVSHGSMPAVAVS